MIPTLTGASMSDSQPAKVELSIVMPCLNEADTLGDLHRARRSARLATRDIAGEVIIADNGSTDGSQEIAASRGARVVPVTERGYGSALMGGIAAARGQFVIMGDADDSYDFGEVPKFVAKLREGYDLVQGCRLPRGGGTRHARRDAVAPSLVGQSDVLVDGAPLVPGARSTTSTAACAGSPKTLYERLDQRCTGMEFATEMIIKAAPATARRSPRCRSRCTPTAAKRTRRTSRPSATAGGRCASSCCAHRGGCSSCPASC